MTDLRCEGEHRRQLVRERGMNGLDHVEVGADQRTLTVYFLAKAPPDVESGNIRIEGGRRITDIRVTDVRLCRVVDPDRDDCVIVTVDRFGDFSPYRLCIVEMEDDGQPSDRPLVGFDPRHSCVTFSFKVDCPSNLDCLPTTDCAPPPLTEPALDYLAKDYASFRQAIFDRMALTMPEWKERHEPDVGVALVELLAYTGDYLSYHQDAVATEAYLGTARLRTSVRRHARLVNYAMHEGCNARAYVCVETDTDVVLPADISLLTGPPGMVPAQRVVTRAELAESATSELGVFMPWPAKERPIYVAHNRIHVYTWGDDECCLPIGATSATLLDHCVECEPDSSTVSSSLHLEPSDVLIFEEVIGPGTGSAADADPARRHAVHLTSVERTVDPVTDDPIVEIEWQADEALPFAVCISAVGPPPDCDLIENVSVVRGNTILVDHGRWVRHEVLGTVPADQSFVPCDDAACGEEVLYTPGGFRPRLVERPLTFREPFTAAGASAPRARGGGAPRAATPHIELSNIPVAPGGANTLFSPSDFVTPEGLVVRLADVEDDDAQALRRLLSTRTLELLEQEPPGDEVSSALRGALTADLRGLLQRWEPRPDLLASDPDDRHFVVEIDNDGFAHVRFGDGDCGCRPEANTSFIADYRVGNGPAGNVGADSIVRLVFDSTVIRNVELKPRNPLAAHGGTAPESISAVKLRAPTAFRSELARAVVAEDYARLAERHPRVQRAAAEMRWTGSWNEVRIAIDAVGGVVAAELQQEVRRLVEPYRRIGHDVVVVPATYVSLRVAVLVCVLPTYLRGHVQAALREVLGAGRLPGGGLGLFHPDNLTFGADVHLSRIVAAARGVPGVENVEVTALQRLHGSPGRELEDGVLKLGPLEIARADGDPDFPEHGHVEIVLEGGR